VLALAGKTYATHGWAIIFLLAMGMLPYHRALLLTTEMRLVGSQWMLTVAYMASQLAFVGISIPLLTVLGASGTAVAWSTSQCLLFFLLQRSVQTSRASQKEYTSV
jgi:hypothetical protein